MLFQILHNLLVDSIGGQPVAERYGTDDAFEHQDVVGQEGNVQAEAKRARDARSTLVVGLRTRKKDKVALKKTYLLRSEKWVISFASWLGFSRTEETAGLPCMRSP
ncbi:hypothetical protein Q1695_001082 [Nippostrongylus brasiliensis]|nr:hypothetical protein Q1695_001082 [Nippostrongylus brasiliensis]